MAPTWIAKYILIFQVFTVLILADHASNGAQSCTFPRYFQGEYFSLVDGEDVETIVDDVKWGDLECKENFEFPKDDPHSEEANHTFLVRSINDNCLICLDVLWRTPNVLQYRKGNCMVSPVPSVDYCEAVVYGLPYSYYTNTMFKRFNTHSVNCASTFEGVSQFSYEYGSGDVCDNPESQIEACQDYGSAYVDNQVFDVTYARCVDVTRSQNKTIRYQCLGSWFAMAAPRIGYTYSAIVDVLEPDPRKAFRCLMTDKDLNDHSIKERWVMSLSATCENLYSLYNAPVTLLLTKSRSVVNNLTPRCGLPHNVSGTWLGVWRNAWSTGQTSQLMVKVNNSYMSFSEPNYEYLDAFDYLCQQRNGTKYLMREAGLQYCEVEYRCFDITEEQGGLYRFRVEVGKPYRLRQRAPIPNENGTYPQRQLQEIFNEACNPTAFGSGVEWRYKTMILFPRGTSRETIFDVILGPTTDQI